MRFIAFLSLIISAYCFPALAHSKVGSESSFDMKAAALVTKYATAGHFSGVALVAKDGKPIFRMSVGLANREWKIPNSPKTVFRIGSTTKQFTAAAIMQLADAGKVQLDDPISKYYPAAPPAWSGVTLRHLLTHTSGIPSFSSINGFIRGPARLDLTPTEFIALIINDPLEFPPGTKFHYDNSGYVLLGIVIEKVSGETYSSYISNHLFKPLGMDHTAYDDTSDVLYKRASGYWLDDGVIKNARAWTTSASYAAGGVRSTVDDLLIWDQALYAAKPASRQSIISMFTDYGNGYGFGSFVGIRHGHKLWDHGGNLPGFSSAFERYPDDGLTVIILSNTEGEQPEQIAKKMAALYFGWEDVHPDGHKN